MAPPALLQLMVLLLSLPQLGRTVASMTASGTSTSTTVVHSNTAPLLGTDGKQIDAHETQIVRWDPSGPWYMYAMKCKNPAPRAGANPALCASEGLVGADALCHPGPPSGGPRGCSKNGSACNFRNDHNVSVFTSDDLSSGSWEWQADILPTGIPKAAYFRVSPLPALRVES